MVTHRTVNGNKRPDAAVVRDGEGQGQAREVGGEMKHQRIRSCQQQQVEQYLCIYVCMCVCVCVYECVCVCVSVCVYAGG